MDNKPYYKEHKLKNSFTNSKVEFVIKLPSEIGYYDRAWLQKKNKEP